MKDLPYFKGSSASSLSACSQFCASRPSGQPSCCQISQAFRAIASRSGCSRKRGASVEDGRALMSDPAGAPFRILLEAIVVSRNREIGAHCEKVSGQFLSCKRFSRGGTLTVVLR